MTTTTIGIHSGSRVRSTETGCGRSARRSRRFATGLAPLAWMALVALAVTAIGSAALLADGVPSASSATIVVRVAPADTLWSIARDNPVPDMSTASVVEAIERANGLVDGRIVPGTLLRVPAPPDSAAALVQASGAVADQ